MRDSVFSRTSFPIFAVGALLLAAGTYGAWRVHRLHQRGSDILSDNVASIRAGEEIETVARELRHRLKRHLSSGNDRHLEEARQLVESGWMAVGDAESLAKTEREQHLIRQLRDGFQAYATEFEASTDAASVDEREERMQFLADTVLTTQVLDVAGEYIELHEEQVDRSRQRNQATANRLMFGLLLLGTCGGVFGLIAGYGIARVVNRKIVQLAIPLRDTAGKLSQVAGPVTLAAEPDFDDLELILKKVSDHVTSVVQRLQESERDQLRAEQLAAVGQLAAGLAHELRNPLTSMKAILQLAPQDGELSPRDLEVLREETERLEQSVQSLLDYARPPEPCKALTNVRELLEHTRQLVDRRAQRKGVSLTIPALQPDIQLWTDAAQLRQVILNLLLNAVDETPRGGEVRLECHVDSGSEPATALLRSNGAGTPRAQAREAARLVIRVLDNGRGLPAELGDEVFEPFVTTKETGTGLGLSICRRIVRSHGGWIAARDRIEGGAEFEVSLPMQDRAAEVAGVAEPKPVSADGRSAPGDT